MEKYKFIAIVGKSGSGKNTLQKVLVDKYGGNAVKKSTTRPRRDRETLNSNDFLTIEEFTEKMLNNKFIEATSFNNWFYGTDIDNLSIDKPNFAIIDPTGLDIIEQDERIKLLTIYIDVSDKNLLLRQLKREGKPNCDEIVRRFQADKKDFNNFQKYNLVFDNNDISIENSKDFNTLLTNLDNFIK